MRIKKISPTTPANGNIENQYGTSQTNAYSEAYANTTFATKDVATTSANGLMSSTDKVLLNNGTTYSTAETRVGTWIDGRPLYRKVLQTMQDITANADTTFSHDISNLRELCFYHFRFKARWSDFWAGESYMGKTGVSFRIYANNITIENNSTTAWQGCTYEFIMYYTKTTD
jgi:hypothetical protein